MRSPGSPRAIAAAELSPVGAMTETEWMASLIAAMRTLGWLAFHATEARKSEPGFPDVLALRGPRALALECKAQDGDLRPGRWTKKGRWLPGQRDWLEAFARAGFECYVVRPRPAADAIGYDDAIALIAREDHPR